MSGSATDTWLLGLFIGVLVALGMGLGPCCCAAYKLMSPYATARDHQLLQTRESSKRALLPGYTDFRAEWSDPSGTFDTFSYTCPSGTTAEAAFVVFEKNHPDVTVVHRGDGELVLNTDPMSPDRGFERRIALDEATRTVTVVSMYGRRDPVVRKFREIHGDRVRLRK